MLFRRKIEPRCEYCKHSAPLGDGAFACVKKGVISGFDSCPRFVYDPYARVPERGEAIRFGENEELKECIDEITE